MSTVKIARAKRQGRTATPPCGSKLVTAVDEPLLLPACDNAPGARPRATSFCRLYAARSGLMKSRSFLYLFRAASASSGRGNEARQHALFCTLSTTQEGRGRGGTATYCETRSLPAGLSAPASSPTRRSPRWCIPSSSASRRRPRAPLRRPYSAASLRAFAGVLAVQPLALLSWPLRSLQQPVPDSRW